MGRMETTMPLDPYDEQTELEDIAVRYDRVFACLPRTWPRLQQDVIFRNLTRRLRGEGWRDWHILQAVMNGVIGWRLERAGLNHDPETMRPADAAPARRFLEEGETADDPPVPLAYFTPTRMEMLLDAGVFTFLKRKGAIFRARHYNHERAHRIVAQRYHYFELDVPHAPLFPDDMTSDSMS